MDLAPVRRALRVASCSGFLGDRASALREVLTGGPVDVVVGDYLAELTMLVLARQRASDPARGYAAPFVRAFADVAGEVAEQGVRVVVNAGGLAPAACADAVRAAARQAGVDLPVAHVEGDDLTGSWAQLAPRCSRLDRAGPGAGTDVPTSPVAANAYLGCAGVVRALAGGASVVVTGRVTDASLLVGAAAWHHGWGPRDLDALAGATLLGHVLECGCQATGGNYAFFRELEAAGADLVHPGFPVAEVAADGSGVITKHPGTGGAVTVGTVTAQLLYEVDGPRYRGPDVTARLDTVRLSQDGPDRVRLSGVRGEPPPSTLKASVSSLGGFRNGVDLVLTGLDVPAKADLLRRQLSRALPDPPPADVLVDLVATARPGAPRTAESSSVLRVVVRDADRERVGRAFSSAVVELALASVPGFHATAPPRDASPYGVFAPVAVPRDAVAHLVVHDDGRREPVPDEAPGGDEHDALPADDGEPPRPAPGVAGPTTRAPLGLLVGARSGDKGGDATLGLWVRRDEEWPWLASLVTPDEVRRLVGEAEHTDVHVAPLPHLRGVVVVLRGLLGEGAAAGLRSDPQAKALGELVRAREVDVPTDLLRARTAGALQSGSSRAEGVTRTAEHVPSGG